MSRTLVRRQKLTAIHDISGAWAGLGSALISVRQQIDIPASWWMTSAVTVYLASISVLHVTSSTLLQFQSFNTSRTTRVQMTRGWQLSQIDPGLSVTLDWSLITASFPVVSQLFGLVSVGLSNSTVYDTTQTNSIVGHVNVSATTISSQCGLLPNITYSVDAGIVSVNSSIDNGTFIALSASYPCTSLWLNPNDVSSLIRNVYRVRPSSSAFTQLVVYW